MQLGGHEKLSYWKLKEEINAQISQNADTDV